MNIKAIIFDLGGVVFDFSFDKTFEHWSKAIGKDVHEIKKQFKFGDSFEKFERNEISPEQFIEYASQQLNHKFNTKNFELGWNAIYLNSFPGIKELLIKLRSNFQLVALTNTNVIHSKIWKTKFADTLKIFEKVFSSHEIRTRKPEVTSYQTVLDYLSLEPQQTLFLDDNEEYINAAKKLGINTILVSSYNEMMQRLKEFEIKVNRK